MLKKSEYQHHDFYQFERPSMRRRVAILKDAFSKCTNWWVDELDCNKSYQRQKVEMSFEDIMKMYSIKCHFTIIHRKGFQPEEYYFEIGFSTMTLTSYYLWIICDEDYLPYFIQKYNLFKMS